MENDSEVIHQLAENIRMFRVGRRWSQENLADESGLHRNNVGRIERGESNASLVTINKLARAFGISVSELFHRGDT